MVRDCKPYDWIRTEMKSELKSRLITVIGVVQLLGFVGLFFYWALSPTPYEEYCAENQPDLSLSECMKLGSAEPGTF